jgi:prepilin-type processing-associated H-X9-DG protein
VAAGFGLWVVLVAAPAIGQNARPGDRPATATAERPLARFVPAGQLAFYAEFQGLDAHAEGWRKSAAFKILNETKLGALLADLAAQGLDAARGAGAGAPGGRKLSGAEVTAILTRVVRQGVALGVTGKAPDGPHVVLVVRGGSRAEVRGLLDGLAASKAAPKGDKTTLRKGARTITQYGDDKGGVAVWDEKGDAVFCDPELVDAVLDALDGKRPSAETDATRTALAKAGGGFEPVGLAFLDMAILPPLPPDAARMGLGGLKRVEARFGFQDDALMSVVRLVAPAPRNGILAMLDQPTFDLSTLPALPAGLTGFTVVSADVGKTYDRVVGLVKASDPAAGAGKVEEAERSWKAAVKIDVRRDLLPHLGPKFALYAPTAAPGAAAAPGMGLLDLTVAAEIDDQKAVASALGSMMEALTDRLKADANAGRAVPEIRKLDGPRLAWTVSLPPGNVPPGIEPTVIVGKNRLVIAYRRASAEAAADLSERAGDRWAPRGSFALMARQLPARMVLLNVNDPRETFPTLVASLPMMLQGINTAMAQAAQRANPGRLPPPRLPIRIDPALVPQPAELARFLAPGSLSIVSEPEGVRLVTRESFPSLTNPATTGIAVALLLPAVQAAREAARRAQCVNNLKQIGLALNNYEAAYGSFPRAAIADKQGKPLLSWRVAILPFIEQDALYKKFKLDEPWDSPHNKALLQSMPWIYACPSATRAEPSLTNYRAFTGKNTLMSLDSDVRLASVTDGTAFTLAVVETKEGVPWTKPEDLPFDPDMPAPAPTYGAGAFHPGGFNALFADGSVKFLKAAVRPETIRALITRNGGEVIAPDDF